MTGGEIEAQGCDGTFWTSCSEPRGTSPLHSLTKMYHAPASGPLHGLLFLPGMSFAPPPPAEPYLSSRFSTPPQGKHPPPRDRADRLSRSLPHPSYFLIRVADVKTGGDIFVLTAELRSLGGTEAAQAGSPAKQTPRPGLGARRLYGRGSPEACGRERDSRAGRKRMRRRGRQ